MALLAAQAHAGNFNPRSPHGERRPFSGREARRHPHFNPRSPHGERRDAVAHGWSHGRFQSTLPARGATLFRALRRAHIVISIHAPRTGSDLHSTRTPSRRGHFNPRSPHGERLTRLMMARRHGPFQSTLPARGATRAASRRQSRQQFQSTLPARGATFLNQAGQPGGKNFNPRSPHGERRG